MSAAAAARANQCASAQAGAGPETSNTVIGIHDGHNASVALVRNGRVEFALQEERITRVKNQGDAPEKALGGALALARSAAGSARIALNGHYMNYSQWQRDKILDDYGCASTFASRMKQPFKDTFLDRAYQRRKQAAREERLSQLGVGRERIEPVEHHLAHASAAYYTCPWPEERVLVLTCDGSGDRLSATVSLGERGNLTRLAQVSEQDSIGRLYAMVTRHLGMAPLEHEYKVMGLAPYVANEAKTAAAAEQFQQLFEFTREPMVWRRRRGVPPMYSASAFLARRLAGQRFDLIAAGVQRFIEDWLAVWGRNCIRETGIRRVACSGGVFMNVKANLRLLAIPELDDLYIFPSCGDESNSIGAALRVAAQIGQPPRRTLGPIYYGEPITDEEASRELELAGTQGKFSASHVSDIEAKIAETLAGGKIVARAKGAMEFGARALGNRSILARADSTKAVRTINEMIKSRDFWMPFAPSVLAERAGEYYSKPKPVESPYMMFAFPSRPEQRAAFAAAQHPYDFTTRPQEVTATHNPDYYRLLKEYEARTGHGIVLNTSFNLHGEPMVYRARDAVDVFLRSGLEYMALGNWWVEKR
ncbi:MAG: carbamoyltransferase C-terminal domain-containing protein [Acidobacteriota bacterium]